MDRVKHDKQQEATKSARCDLPSDALARTTSGTGSYSWVSSFDSAASASAAWALAAASTCSGVS